MDNVDQLVFDSEHSCIIQLNPSQYSFYQKKPTLKFLIQMESVWNPLVIFYRKA